MKNKKIIVVGVLVFLVLAIVVILFLSKDSSTTIESNNSNQNAIKTEQEALEYFKLMYELPEETKYKFVSYQDGMYKICLLKENKCYRYYSIDEETGKTSISSVLTLSD